ncbi:hypothetical protein KJ815_06770, partial [bacterium]|nr:hypothetical protein [bacterium]
ASWIGSAAKDRLASAATASKTIKCFLMVLPLAWCVIRFLGFEVILDIKVGKKIQLENHTYKT